MAICDIFPMMIKDPDDDQEKKVGSGWNGAYPSSDVPRMVVC